MKDEDFIKMGFNMSISDMETNGIDRDKAIKIIKSDITEYIINSIKKGGLIHFNVNEDNVEGFLLLKIDDSKNRLRISNILNKHWSEDNYPSYESDEDNIVIRFLKNIPEFTEKEKNEIISMGYIIKENKLIKSN